MKPIIFGDRDAPSPGPSQAKICRKASSRPSLRINIKSDLSVCQESVISTTANYLHRPQCQTVRHQHPACFPAAWLLKRCLHAFLLFRPIIVHESPVVAPLDGYLNGFLLDSGW